MKKVIIVLAIFILDRATKLYLINLQESGVDIDFYILPFLNLFLVWNTGIGFGLISLESNIFYHAMTAVIALINIVIIFLLIKSKSFYVYPLIFILGGAIGNLFDRVYYYAVPDFIDIHIGQFHWFIFNVADIFITVGIIIIMFLELKKKKLQND